MTEREKKLESAIKAYLAATDFGIDEVIMSMSCGCERCIGMVNLYALVTEGVEVIHVGGDGNQSGNIH